MAVKIMVNDRVLTAYLEGELDHHSAAGIRTQIDDAIQRNMPELLVLDFGNISFMDSSGIGLVMGRYKLLQPNHAKINITNTSPTIYKVMKLAGLDRLASIDKGGLKNGKQA